MILLHVLEVTAALGSTICNQRPPSRVNNLLPIIPEAQVLKSPMMYGQAWPEPSLAEAAIPKRYSRLAVLLKQDEESKLFDASNESLIDAYDGNITSASDLFY
ncbi:hypothetical protein E4U09_003991 [Claviceps aff. purpurea]|uniref:Uncharacterized protein n=1 Tax=Claviceps aff. purpurea TaxID=1967640 RepID=A0A9P7QG01_9HYPO|nr:hypothetical protein E4U09_003991 [Claviceps aff. purpurea]